MFEVSFSKVLAVAALWVPSFVLGCYAIGFPTAEPGFIVFMCFTAVFMTPVFAAFIFLTLRCRIGRHGLRAPTHTAQLIPWSEVTAVRKAIFGHIVRGKGLSDFALLPSRILLKNPDSFRQLIEHYAPAENIVRKRLAPQSSPDQK